MTDSEALEKHKAQFIERWKSRILKSAARPRITYKKTIVSKNYTATQIPPDPIFDFTRPPVSDEFDKIYNALKILNGTKTTDEPIIVPETWVILDKLAVLQVGYALGQKGVIYRHALDSEFLPAILANIIAWFNLVGREATVERSEIRENTQELFIGLVTPAQMLTEYRHGFAPFGLVRIPDYVLNEQELREERYTSYKREEGGFTPYEELREVKAKTHKHYKLMGLPEDLRPKPIDVLIGGGLNYRSFGYKETEQHSLDIEENSQDSERGLLAVLEYMEFLDYADYVNITTYSPQPPIVEWFWDNGLSWVLESFKHREETAEKYKAFQLEADKYTATKLGQGNQLIELLKRFQKLSPAPSYYTTHFFNPLQVRIEKLQELT